MEEQQAYLSPQTVGFNYYQKLFSEISNPVSVASYENNAVTSTDIAFSGSGTDRTQMYACNIHPGIPKVNGLQTFYFFDYCC